MPVGFVSIVADAVVKSDKYQPRGFEIHTICWLGVLPLGDLWLWAISYLHI